MRISTKTSLLIVLLAVTFTGCAEKTKGKSVTNNYTTNTSTIGGGGSGTGTGGTGTDGTPTTVDGCDGVYKDGASSCYYNNLPRIIVAGPGTPSATVLWSSLNLNSSISQDQFRSDGSITVRLKAFAPYSNETTTTSVATRTCGGNLTKFSKMKVMLMVRGSGVSMTTYKELTANINGYSNKVRFDVPAGSSSPFVMEVVGVQTDHRCKLASLTPDMVTACNNGTYFGDIPVYFTAPTVTYCAGFQLEYSTDTTYGLP